ncbi:maleylpyruvate isomerase family mycothiol-dependent enzyme [Actinomadura rugatobispora]|uniref:Maleylpyruvate isomerase family mycothiol-dependent enzyme n=1 Tax=Actinomadura rugatobispora TaxID=1994 RepID=A0ABW1AEL3_9ACTN|nr:TIGR03084 family metal-binding protein [Actinomadura rugatobispora]
MDETPAALRAGILGAAFRRRPPVGPLPGHIAPYAAQVSTLDVLLAELDGPDWSAVVIYDWNVQDVVAHLMATDRLLADQLSGERPPESDVDARTAAAITSERAHSPEETRTAWRRHARDLCTRLTGPGTPDKVWIRQPLRLENAVVARAFETWVHATDIAAAVRRSLPVPLPDHLHAIADLGVRSLPAALAARGIETTGTARVLLEGPGGGDWLVPLGDDHPRTTLRLDVLDFCMLAADRRTPAEVDAAIEGDPTLAHHLLAAAPAFAGP